MRKAIFILMALVLAIGLTAVGQMAPVLAQDVGPVSADKIALGKLLFFDANLSVNGTQSCATCHAPEVGFSGPDSLVNAAQVVYPGALEDRFGNRKPPTSAYGGDSPDLHYDATLEKWVGGMFFDGRATGWVLHDPLAEQAGGPFLNPLEMGAPNVRHVCLRVARSEYAGLFKEVWGSNSLDCVKDADGAYEQIIRSIAAYEESPEVNPFSSKFDKFWDNAKTAGKDVTKIQCPGMGMGCGMPGMGAGGGMMNNWPNRWTTYRGLGLDDYELIGLAVFNDPHRANCASCHSLTAGSAGYPVFTNFGYDNIGVPKNPQNPFYLMPQRWNPDGVNWVDYGLGDFLKSAGYAPEDYEAQMGKIKVPTLRNVDLRPSPDFVKAYGHNGYFKSLDDLIMFYSWRGLTMNGGLGMGGSGMDCGTMGGGGGMGGGGMGGGMGGDMTMMCDPDLFPQPEVTQNLTPMNHFSMMHQSYLVTFLKTLSDGYFQR